MTERRKQSPAATLQQAITRVALTEVVEVYGARERRAENEAERNVGSNVEIQMRALRRQLVGVQDELAESQRALAKQHREREEESDEFAKLMTRLVQAEKLLAQQKLKLDEAETRAEGAEARAAHVTPSTANEHTARLTALQGESTKLRADLRAAIERESLLQEAMFVAKDRIMATDAELASKAKENARLAQVLHEAQLHLREARLELEMLQCQLDDGAVQIRELRKTLAALEGEDPQQDAGERVSALPTVRPAPPND